MSEEVLAGGVANAGSVVRVDGYVLRPSNANTDSIHTFLRRLRAGGFSGASLPVGVDADGRERLEFIPGDTAAPPYPRWVQADSALASIARLMAEFHAVSSTFDPSVGTWSTEMSDPRGGMVVCHNDVCLENVVFREGIAVGLIDFDFCSPGRPIYDLAQFARMCTPVDDDTNAARVGWVAPDKPARLRLIADSYGLDADGRQELVEALDDSMEQGATFIRRRVGSGDPNFAAMWNAMGGSERFDRRQRWWHTVQSEFVAAMR